MEVAYLPKIRVHELAKEFEISSKELLNFLDKLDIKDKKAASNLSDDETGTVRNFFRNAAANTAKMAQEKGSAKKPKPGSDRLKPSANKGQTAGERQTLPGRRPERNEGFQRDRRTGRQGGERSMGGNAGLRPGMTRAEDIQPVAHGSQRRSVESPAVKQPSSVDEPAGRKPVQAAAAATADAPVVSNPPESAAVEAPAKATVPSQAQEARTATEGEAVKRPQSDRPGGERPQGERPHIPRPQGDRQQGERPHTPRPQGDRQQGDRPYTPRLQGERPQGERPYTPRPQGDRRQGDRPYTPRPQGERPQGDRPYTPRPQGDRQQGDRPYTPRPQGERPYTPRPQGERPGGQRPPYQGQGGPRPGGQGQAGPRPGGYRPGGQGGQGGPRPGGQGYMKKDGPDNKDGRKFQSSGGPQRGGQKPAGAGSSPAQKPTHKRSDKSKDITKKTKQESIYEDAAKAAANKGPRMKKISKKDRRKLVQAEKEQQEALALAEREAIGIKVITMGKNITVKDLAEKLGKATAEIIKPLMKIGIMATINQEIDFYTASNIADSFDILVEEADEIDIFEEAFKGDVRDEEAMIERPPVVVVMGHVDHGKTSLLDAIRMTNVTVGEAGGITQHIGAYTVDVRNRPITFLDTPGHEAFTAMRMRGAQVTDIAILVVAADDGVMPQTIEAINHARAANVEIIVAINKIDKPTANPDRVKQELTEYGILTEDWGGETICAPVSALQKTGIDDLLEMILLAAEMRQLKADPHKRARGTVIESQLDKGRGPVATVLVQEGTLKVGDPIVAGACHGRIRAMVNDKGEKVRHAGPSIPVEVLGLNEVPLAGDVFYIADNERQARQVAETVVARGREDMIKDTPQKVSLDDLFSQIKSGNIKDLNIVIKADVAGSVEAVKNSLERLSNEEVRIRTIHGGVGAVTESDVMLAAASNAIIIGFNVRPENAAQAVASDEKVDIRLYRVIYNAIEDITAAMKGMLDPEFVEKVIGHATIRQIFKASGIGTIGGAYVSDGKIQRNAKVRIVRDGVVIHEGDLNALRRFKDDVREVSAGYECGLTFTNFNDIKEDDTVEAFIMEEVAR